METFHGEFPKKKLFLNPEKYETQASKIQQKPRKRPVEIHSLSEVAVLHQPITLTKM